MRTWPAWTNIARQIVERVAEQQALVFVAEWDGRVVGFAHGGRIASRWGSAMRNSTRSIC